MANVFNDLALQYVYSTDLREQISSTSQAAAALETSANTRLAVGQWVSSINRWMRNGVSTDGQNSVDGDGDIIERAKALDFLADTLTVLNKDMLKADQVKLLIGFFNSLFSSDHRAGITASTKALRQLIMMKTFQTSSGNDIIMSVTKLGEDFKRQTPATRLEIYELFHILVSNPLVANDLVKQHGDEWGFMTALLDLCRSERDPLNLLKWFEIQKLFLQKFSPNKSIATEVFKSFSDYFPITLRASATSSGVTAEDLKRTLRSCFAAHERIADLAIAFLINKLDQGDAVTVAVKVDILQTLEACLSECDSVYQGVCPFVDQVWSSLKYEVRHGEIQDSIQATLKTIRTLTKRLEGEELENFLLAAWTDLVDDLSDHKYSGRAGKLLIAIAGASPRSFFSSTPRILNHVKDTLKLTNIDLHKVELLSLLNSLLLLRANFAEDASWEFLRDELFGDSLFEEVYARMWSASRNSRISSAQIDLVKQVIDGMAVLMLQPSKSDQGLEQLCSAAVCHEIFNTLGEQCITYRLQQRPFFTGVGDHEEVNLRNAGAKALEKMAPLYPRGYRLLLQQFLSMFTNCTKDKTVSSSILYEVASRLAKIGCTRLAAEPASPIANFVSLVNTLLDGLLEVLDLQPELWTVIIGSIQLAMSLSFDALRAASKEETLPKLPPHALPRLKTGLPNFGMEFDDILPAIDKDKRSNMDATAEALDKLKGDPMSAYQQYMGYCVFVIAQIYRRFTSVKPFPGSNDLTKWTIGLSLDFDSYKYGADRQDRCLHQVSRLTALVIRRLTPEDQLHLAIWENAFLMFREYQSIPGDPNGLTFASLSRTLSSIDEYRTAPLVLGIFNGLWPAAMREMYHSHTLLNVCETLTRPPFAFSNAARAALNSILTVLSNKYDFANDELADEWERAHRTAAAGFERVMRRAATGQPDMDTCVAIFKSVLHFLAGDVARFRTKGQSPNWLLLLICDTAPAETTIGRRLSQCFEILVSPKEDFAEGHAVVKKLSHQWCYTTTVKPQLPNCFPAPPERDDRVATNHSIAVLAILKHINYACYSSEARHILLVTIRSISVFKIGKDMDSALYVLLQILAHDPECVREHLNSLVTHTLSVYQMARNVTEGLEIVGNRPQELKEAINCRLSTLKFFEKLPQSIETRHLLPYRQSVSRGLALACGDQVREVRYLALSARRIWLNNVS